jgi:peptidoglycan/xylan/chitin deacetylase (PgdA/CDA1 family)
MRYIYSLVQKFTEFRNREFDNFGKIYMFHQVNDDKTKWNNEPVCITKQNFNIFIEKHIENGYSFKSIRDLGTHISPKDVFITFDDIFLDAYENAITYLNQKKIPYAVFITSDYINQNKYVTEFIVKELAENSLCVIGAHTKTHPKLRFLADEEVQYETSKVHLEKIINRSIDYFAFPYGSKYACSKRNIEIVKHAGYKMAFSTYTMGINKEEFEKHKYFLPRININNKTYLNWGN